MRKITIFLSLLMALVLTANAQVTSLDQLSNNKKYTIAALGGAAQRGTWCFNPEDPIRMYSTNNCGATVDVNDVNQQFAFLNIEGNYYLYSVGGDMFVSYNSNGRTTISDYPGSVCTFLQSTNANTDFPWVVALDGHHVGLSTNYDCGVITFYQSTNDGGNCISITEVEGEELSEDVANRAKYLLPLGKYIEKAQTIIDNFSSDTELCATLQNLINNVDKSSVEAMQASIASFQAVLDTPQDNTVLTATDGLPGTSMGSYYHWDSPVITLPAATNKLRFTVSKTNTGATFNNYVFFTIGEFKLYDADGNQITLSADNFSTNAQHSTEGPLANICDGNQATYFHSRYSGEAVPGGLHYIEIQLPQPMSSFKFSFDSRNGNNVPTTIAVSTEKFIIRKDLETAITTAESYKDSWNDVWRIGAGYNNYTQAEGDEDFVTALNDVKAFNENMDANTTAEQIQAQIDRLNTLISHLSINLPVNNSFLRIRCVDGMRRILSSVVAEGGENPAGRPELANTVEANSIFYYADNKLLAYTTGQYIDDRAYVAVGEEGRTVGFTAASNGNVGSYNFFVTNASGTKRYQYGALDYMDSGSGTNASNGYCWWLEEVNSLPVTFAKNFATLWTPVALTIPAGVTAYTATLNDEGDALTLNQLDGTIPANTGVLLYTENIDTYNFNITTDVDGVEKGSLTGQANTILASSVENNVFTLQTVENEMGFKNYTGENLNGFKARLETSSASAAQAIRLIFGADDTTGINGVTTADKAKAAIYDLSGRRVAQPAKGIYIVGGKKVLFK